MEQSVLKTAPAFPCTLLVHKDRSPLITHQYSMALFVCQANYVFSPQKDPFKDHNRWMNQHKDLAYLLQTPPTINFPEPLRVRSGKPVHQDLLKSLGIYVDISSYTENVCTFDHDPATGLTTLVVDDSKIPFKLKPGLYTAALKIQSPMDFWYFKKDIPRLLINTQSDAPVALCLTLCSLVSSQKPKTQKLKLVEGSLSYYIQDFRKTFNL